MITAASVAGGLALLAGVLGRHAWFLDLFSHFRVQYAALFALLAVVSLLLGRKVLAAAALAGALISAIPLVQYLSAPGVRADGSSRDFRLVSVNVWFRNREHARIAAFLERTQADAIVLQELSRSESAELHARLSSYPYAYMDSGPHGVVVFARWPIVAGQSIPLGASELPRKPVGSHVVIDWRGQRVNVLGVHLHWPLGAAASRLRNEELLGIAAFASRQKEPLLVAGDFNITAWSAHFRDLLRRSGLNDCALGQGLWVSWPAQFPPLGIRIDHCLASAHWRTAAVSTGPYLGSDHFPLIADLLLAR